MRPAFVYLHVPFCRLRCPFCKWVDRTARATQEGIARFLARLAEDIARFDFGPYDVQGVAVGGGTPSLLSADQMEKILTAVRERLPARVSLQEVSVEVHPRDGEPERLAGYRRAGVNRLSIGAQSFDEESLAALGRPDERREVLQTLDAARAAGFDNLNVDLLFGFPGARDALVDDVRQAIALGIEHVTLSPLDDRYAGYARWEQQAARQGRVRPPREEVRQAAAQAARLLEGAGYARTHSMCFARPGRAFRYQEALFERTGDILSFGPGTASYLGNEVVRVDLDVVAYLEAQGAPRSQSGLACGDFFFLSLQTRQGFSRRRFADTFGIEFEQYASRSPEVARALAELKHQGLVEDDGELIRYREG